MSTDRSIPLQVTDGLPQAVDDPLVETVDNARPVLARVRSWDGRTEELLAPLMERSQADAGA